LPKNRNCHVGKDTVRVTQFSRRQFLKSIGMRLGGAMIGGISLASACKLKSTNSIVTGTDTHSNTTNSVPTTTTVPTVSPTNSADILTTSTVSQPTPSSTATDDIFSYFPSEESPPVITVPNSTCTVATDRLYSLEHIWVKKISTDLVVLGITPSLVAILYEPYGLFLPEIGLVLTRGDSFGMAEGWKTTADLISPVSGSVVFVNEILARLGKQSAEIALINFDPFNGGWMVVIKIDKPDELNDLMTPAGYLERLGK
jgi:glycine cleavage system H protein